MAPQFLAGTGFGSDLFARVRQAVSPAARRSVGRGAPGDPALYQAASLLLDYPHQELLDRLPLIRELVDERGAEAEPMLPLLDLLASRPLEDLQAEYVETFDLRRRCCLYLTYYRYGDTRKRGTALVDFKDAYSTAGAVMEAAELPDHLGVLLEFGAQYDLERCRTLLVENRAGLELLRLSLTDRESAWAGVLEAVSATLPAIGGDDHDAVRRLVAQGPPDEDVGLEAFTSSSYLESGARP
ncbi:MAG TPA: nitrate reductase molybdenum cofactor assembly chaperone [Candidatus Dietzia intestinipullorum]|nr:nitrate reductase molybdenum cofactor assembly chaperone [Candidatus Dietzia intestinipullorum]